MKASLFPQWTRIVATSSLLLLSGLPSVAADKEKREANEPSFSADGTQLVYRADVVKAGEVLASTQEIWIVNRDGTGARALTSGARDEHPRFTPDGKLVAFMRDRDIWLVNADGSDLRNLTNTKDAFESKAEFTSRGDLVFLRDVKDPSSLFGLNNPQTVVWRRMDDNSERDIVGNGYAVAHLEPNPIFDDAVFIICKALDNDGKPMPQANENPVIAVAKRDGSPPRTVVALRPEDKIVLQELHVRNDLNFVVARWPEKTSGGVALLKDGKIAPLPDAPIFGDVSRDGKTIAGVGIVKGGETLFGLVLYDVQSKLTSPLLQLADGIVPTAKGHFDEGKKQFFANQYATAITELTRAIEIYPKYADAFHYRGWARYSNKQTEAALKDLGEAIRLDPKLASARLTRARILIWEDRGGEAMDDFNAALIADPNDAQIYFERGELYLKRAQLDAALKDFDAALKIKPNGLSFLMKRGDTLAKTGDNAAAIKDYSAAIAAFPKYAGAYQARAKRYRVMGQNDLALADEEKFKQLQP